MHDADRVPLLPSSDAARGAPRASRLGARRDSSDARSAAASRIQRRVRLFLDARRRQRRVCVLCRLLPPVRCHTAN